VIHMLEQQLEGSLLSFLEKLKHLGP